MKVEVGDIVEWRCKGLDDWTSGVVISKERRSAWNSDPRVDILRDDGEISKHVRSSACVSVTAHKKVDV
jgi:hypothetical protein